MPLREIKAYTNRPITTVGRANKVLIMVMSSCFAGIFEKATTKPKGMPITLAISVDELLTFKETAMIAIISGSIDTSNRNAEIKLSSIKSILTTDQ